MQRSGIEPERVRILGLAIGFDEVEVDPPRRSGAVAAPSPLSCKSTEFFLSPNEPIGDAVHHLGADFGSI